MNDVFLNEQKVSGNLCLSEIQGEVLKVTCGIGINLNTDKELYQKLETPGTTLKSEVGIEVDTETVFYMLTEILDKNLDEFFASEDGFKHAHSYIQGKMRLLGHPVRILTPEDELLYQGLFTSFNDDGSITLKKDNGEEEKIYNGRMRA